MCFHSYQPWECPTDTALSSRDPRLLSPVSLCAAELLGAARGFPPWRQGVPRQAALQTSGGQSPAPCSGHGPETLALARDNVMLNGTRCPGSRCPTCAAISVPNSRWRDSHGWRPATWLGSAPANGTRSRSPVRASAVPWQAVSLLRGFPRFAESERPGVQHSGDAGLGSGRGCRLPMALAATKAVQEGAGRDG